MRVVVAEDSGLLRQLLVQALTERGLAVIGQAASLPELLAVVSRDPPDVVILDIRMPPRHNDEGLQAAESIRADHPSVGLLVLTHYAETAYAVRLLGYADRAVGYIVKDRVQDTDRLLEAVRRVAAGEVVVDSLVVQQVLHRPRTVNPLDRLTPTETEVLALVAEGYSNSAIARKLSYSVKTVEKRLTTIADKLQLPSVADGRTDVNVRVLAVLTYIRNVQLDRRPALTEISSVQAGRACGSEVIEQLNEGPAGQGRRGTLPRTEVQTDTTVGRPTLSARPTRVCWPARSVR